MTINSSNIPGVSLVLQIAIVLLLSCVCLSAPQLRRNTSNLLSNGLFEGDLKISDEIIRKHYNLSSVPGVEDMIEKPEGNGNSLVQEDNIRDKRAATSEDRALWVGNIVPYEYSSNIPNPTAELIRDAMDHWEDHTCLRFVARSQSHRDYIEFDNTNDGCYSSSIGRSGGRQIINLETTNLKCHSCRTVVHEIGHAIGFWHEQSRPDRDRYVTINFTNIIDGKEHNFMKRNDHEVDYQGVTYDYGSIMHYHTNAFSKNESFLTIVVSKFEYRRQGEPAIGRTKTLSLKDIEQANRLYSCPDNGIRGALIFHVKSGVHLPDTDPIHNSPDPYVKFTIVDSRGVKYYRQSSIKSGTTSPTWNEWIYVQQLEWRFFRVRVWDADSFLTYGDDSMSMSQTIVIQSGAHNMHHSANTGYVTFSYRFVQLITGKFTMTLRYARRLQDTDPIYNSPDPYVRVVVVRSDGVETARNTRVIGGTQNPTWNQWINFGCQEWAVFNIQIKDDDYTGGDDDMSHKETVFVQSGVHNKRHQAYGSGYLIYTYHMIRDGNECSRNPCRNGGRCIDRCVSYYCSCTSRYTGTNCEHLTGNLKFYARYGRYLPDRDGWGNDSDPYIEFIAIDVFGNSVRKITSIRRGDHNPNWYQWIYFGTRAWRQFWVRVYDDDYINGDDALSNRRKWRLSSLGSQRYMRLNCHSGYVYFDYSFN